LVSFAVAEYLTRSPTNVVLVYFRKDTVGQLFVRGLQTLAGTHQVYRSVFSVEYDTLRLSAGPQICPQILL
jgi:hypothetical protein